MSSQMDTQIGRRRNTRIQLGILAASICFAMLSPPQVHAAFEIDPPEFYGAVDIVTDFGIENPPADSGRLRVRSFELGASTLIDSMWSAHVNIGGHDESGIIDFELHEAFLSSEQLLENTEVKAGRFYLGVGLLNRVHSYEWPFMSAPKVQTTFFGKEPIADTGLEITHRFSTSAPIDVTVGVTNGWSYSHRPATGRRPLAATHYVHPSILFLVSENRTLSFGLNYFGRTDVDSLQTSLTGLDFVLKNKNAAVLGGFFLQGEIYHRTQASSTLPLAEDVGVYVWGEGAIGQTRWGVGARVDGFTTLSLRNANGEKRANLDYGVTPTISYRASNASTFRASYGYLVETKQGDNTRAEQKIELQLIALLGEAPARIRTEIPSTD